jgi:hypothetical protein
VVYQIEDGLTSLLGVGKRTHRRILPGILQPHRNPTVLPDRVRLLRYVATLPRGHPPKLLPGVEYSRPLPHRGQAEPGAGRGARRRIAPHGPSRLGASVKENALVPAQTQREPHRQAEVRLRDLLRYNLKTVRAYLLKEDFQQLWDYDSATWAGKFLDEYHSLGKLPEPELTHEFF